MNDDSVYLEADEDITSAIDKLKKSPASVVQIVVPKRSPMLQSIINLKLLKKAADTHKKQLVLVTSDKIAGDLAARVGLAVAPSLGAKAVIGHAAAAPVVSPDDDIIDESDGASDEPDSQTGTTPPAPPRPKKPFLKRREVPDAGVVAGVAASSSALAAETLPAGAPPAPPADQDSNLPSSLQSGAEAARKAGPRVPNYRKLQRRVFWVGLGALLIGGYVLGMYALASADVTVYANGTKTDIDTNFTVKPGGTTDKAAGTLAGEQISASKDLSGTFTPTGKKDVGTKATGTITISNCLDASSHMFVAGTRFQAPDGKIFRSTADAVTPGGSGNFFGCTTPGIATVEVVADQNGDSYNEAPATYTIPGLPANQQSGQNSISAKGGQMAGGSSKTVTVVTQADIDSAVAAALEKDSDSSGRELQAKAPSSSQVLSASETTKTSDIVPTPVVDTEATSATIAFKVTYSALAVKKSEYQNIIEAQEVKQIGAASQIYDNGLSAAQVTASPPDSSGNVTFHFTTQAFSGTKIDKSNLAKSLTGKRYGDAVDLIKQQPGVANVDVELHPSWAFNLPSRAGKINIAIKINQQ